jgi:hypothetical protein
VEEYLSSGPRTYAAILSTEDYRVSLLVLSPELKKLSGQAT